MSTCAPAQGAVAPRRHRPRWLEPIARCALFLFLTGAALLPAAGARGHDRSVSQSMVRVDGHRVRVSVRSRTVDLSALTPELAVWAHDSARGERFEALPEALVEAHRAHFRVVDSEGRACTAGAPLRTNSPPAELRIRFVFECAAAPARYVVTPWPVPGHHHLAHMEGSSHSLLVVGGDGTLPLLAAETPSSGASGSMGTATLAYLRYGATHAATGWDHILFVLLLLAFAPRLRDAAVLVTGFTLGHALTLALAALSVLESRGRAVEALIAASVVLVAAENVAHGEPTPARRAAPPAVVALGALVLFGVSGERALMYFAAFALCAAGLRMSARDAAHLEARTGPSRAQATRVRLGLAVTFGLVHGLGFASGFDASGPFRVPRLVAFNLGVELAQLACVALAWPLLRYLGDDTSARRQRAVRAFSVLAGSAATYACVTRALSL